jgi:hypothetical protein
MKKKNKARGGRLQKIAWDPNKKPTYSNHGRITHTMSLMTVGSKSTPVSKQRRPEDRGYEEGPSKRPWRHALLVIADLSDSKGS